MCLLYAVAFGLFVSASDASAHHYTDSTVLWALTGVSILVLIILELWSELF